MPFTCTVRFDGSKELEQEHEENRPQTQTACAFSRGLSWGTIEESVNSCLPLMITQPVSSACARTCSGGVSSSPFYPLKTCLSHVHINGKQLSVAIDPYQKSYSLTESS